MDKDQENNGSHKTNINWYPGHMAKAKREIIEDLKLIDVVIEILDARIPISSQNPDIKNIINKKKRIIILNKYDLANETETRKWQEYFKKQGIETVLVNSNTGDGIRETINKIEKIMQDEREENARKGRINKTIRVLVLGIPNVGKSSFINRISKRKTATVGNKPGVTVKKQWIRIANNIELMDTPGILWPKFESEQVGLNLAFTGTIKDEIIDKEEISFYLLKYLLNNHLELLAKKYKLDEEKIKDILKQYDETQVIIQLMEQIGKNRGALVSGGKVDNKKVSNILLQDFREGKIGRITLEKCK